MAGYGTIGGVALRKVVPTGSAASARDGRHTQFAVLMEPYSTKRIVKPGRMLFLEGDRSDFLFIVVSGCLRGYRMTVDGRRHIARFMTAGDVVALTSSKEHDYTAEAVSPTQILCCPRATVERLMREDAAFREAIFERIDAELAALRDQMVLLGQFSAEERAATFLSGLAARNGGPEGEVHLPMTRRDIGDFLGLSFETVSRMFNDLKRKGIIEMTSPNRFRVSNPDELSALAAA